MRKRSWYALSVWALGLIIPLAPSRAEEPLRLGAVDDVALTVPAGLAGFIVVTLESSGGNNEIRILDLEQGMVLRPRYVAPPITDVASASGFPGIVSSRPGGREVVSSALDGSGALILAAGGPKKSDVTFGRMPGQFLFVGEFSSLSKEIFSLTSEGSASLQQLTQFGSRNTTPSMNPVTGQIAYSTARKFPGWDVCIFNPSTGSDSCPLGSRDDSFCRPKWSPDGSRLVYSRGTGSSVDLYIYSASSGSSARLTDLTHKEYDGAWSADGSHIVFSHNPSGTDVYGLKVVRVSDGEVFRLASSSLSLRGATWTDAVAYTLATPGPTATPEASPSATPTAVPTVEPSVTPAPTQTPIPPRRAAPRIVLSRFSDDLVRLAIVLPESARAAPYTVRVQVNWRVIERNTTRRRVELVVRPSSLVRAAWKQGSEKLLSAWGPWTRAEAASRNRNTRR